MILMKVEMEMEMTVSRCDREREILERKRAIWKSSYKQRRRFGLPARSGKSSLGRDLLVDWYVHSPAGDIHNLSAEAVVEIGDLDFAARCMVLGKERQMACELGGGVEVPPYLLDPCRYHEHRRMGLPCYKRSRGSVFSQLEYAVRCGLGGCEDLENDGDDGGLGETMLCEYEACVDQSMEVFLGDEVSLED